ncbi:hypothetical protein FHW58_000755 [Duganella sp. 1224]|uniref:hypothetical protein n=1 Tax=Duganella sp. 1224 TaxID=2587052 RepID=UPI0015CC0FE6|nr:hypothetical protein [Duganella sp. 1224]NYE59603.1 hypothetical protein [Duganella sp. 1224]
MRDVIASLDLTFHVNALPSGACMLCKLPDDAPSGAGGKGSSVGVALSRTLNTGGKERTLLLAKGDIVVITDSSDAIQTNIKWDHAMNDYTFYPLTVTKRAFPLGHKMVRSGQRFHHHSSSLTHESRHIRKPM